MEFEGIVLYKVSVNTVTTNRVSGPPLGGVSAHREVRPAHPIRFASGPPSGIVFDATRFARMNMSYGICGGVTFSLMACVLVEHLRQDGGPRSARAKDRDSL